MPTPLLPSPKVVVREALLEQSAVTASKAAGRIYFAIPASPIYPLWVLSSVDDGELRPETLTARVKIDIWGAGPSTQHVLDCEDMAAIVRSVARDLDGDWASGKIRNCVAGATLPSPDPTGRARLIIDLLFELNQ